MFKDWFFDVIEDIKGCGLMVGFKCVCLNVDFICVVFEENFLMVVVGDNVVCFLFLLICDEVDIVDVFGCLECVCVVV